MARTNSTTQNKIDPTRPFYAAVGSVDAAVAFARTSLAEAQTRFGNLDLEPKSLAGDLQKEVQALPGRVEAAVNGYVAELSDTVAETVDDLNKQYVDLAARGRTLVGRIRRQQSTQDLKAETRKTASRAKGTARTTSAQAGKAASTAGSSAKRTARTTSAQTKKAATTAKDSAKTTASSAKSTGTEARKTAAAAGKATQAAAAKTGS